VSVEHDKQGVVYGEANATAKDALRLTYTPHQDTTPEDEIRALALVDRYILECAEREKAPGVGDDG
jgi:hypothetical protein